MNFPDSYEQELAGRIHYLTVDAQQLPEGSEKRIKLEQTIQELKNLEDKIIQQQFAEYEKEHRER